jgi:hypothetical protein
VHESVAVEMQLKKRKKSVNDGNFDMHKNGMKAT